MENTEKVTANLYMEYGGEIRQWKNLMNILKEIDDSIDYAKECALIDDRLLDSFGVITLVSELEDAFDIDIEAAEMTPENFNSAESIWKMIKRLQEN